jgi:prepilin-type N-terminal cleavage/methylation domain-containing protein
MTQAQQDRDSRKSGARVPLKSRGFTMIEVVMVMLVGLVLTAVALPQVKTGINNYRLNSAVAMAKWAIQSTRFQALEKGYIYQVVFTATTNGYKTQFSTDNGATYTDVPGSTTPLAAWPMTFSADTTINFRPNGFVTATVGTNSFTITYQGTIATITVSNYGNVAVSCSNNVINPTC